MQIKQNNQQKIIGQDSSSQEGASMILFLALIPWVLTVSALLFIMVHRGKMEEIHEDPEDLYGDYETIRVAVYEDRAYWVMDNVFYESDVIREPDFETARPIETMDLSPKELNKLLTILDDLEKSKNERD